MLEKMGGFLLPPRLLEGETGCSNLRPLENEEAGDLIFNRLMTAPFTRTVDTRPEGAYTDVHGGWMCPIPPQTWI